MYITIKIDEVTLLKEVLENLPEYAESFQCTKWDYKNCVFNLVDKEDGKKYTLTLDKAKAGLEKLVKEILGGNFPGLNYLMTDITDAGNWDAPALDALLQISVLGEVIYG